MDVINRKVDEIWESAYSKNPKLMTEWLQCFSRNYHESVQKSKEEIKMTLARRDYQTDPGRNFLWRLMSKEAQKYGYLDRNEKRTRRVDLAMLFVQVMMDNSDLEDFVVTTLDARQSEINLSINLTNINLAMALRAELTENNLNETTSGATELHMAARYEDVEKVKNLVENGKYVENNPRGYTPLHFAAMAINPQPKIAELLIKEIEGILDKRTDPECGRNTALHIAAANVNVTEKFIQKFKKANPQLHDSLNDTPFHVAAKSTNPQTIIYMLNTFAPTNNHWDVDVVDEGKTLNTLIKICARRGNAKAVALLIKHGADISKGVLHELVLESVRNPQKISNLARVYQTVVDNAVTWRCLEEQPEFLQAKASDDYAEIFRETMIWLLTKPAEDYGGEDVLQCALSHAASAMFWEIINTKSVFRMQGEEALKFVGRKRGDGVTNIGGGGTQSGRENWTVFDVTNFAKETMVKPNSCLTKYATDASERAALCSSCRQDEDRALEDPAEENNERNFDMPSVPKKSYLTYLLTVFDQWKNSNILSTQPFKELTTSYITTVQRFYFILGLLQLIFVACFSLFCMPNTCSLARMFNVSTTGCGSTNNNSDDVPSFSDQRSWMALLWLIWPVILLIGDVLLTFHSSRQSCVAQRGTYNKMVVKSKDLEDLSFLIKLQRRLLPRVPMKIFCFAVFAWLYYYYRSESSEQYAKVTAMVLLFGWITNLSFFGAVSKNVSISKLVVEKIIVKDILSFMLFFGFSVVGFSFAMHTIRMSACMPNQIVYLHETFFAVLSSAFGIGDFFETTITDPACTTGEDTQYLFEFVYLGYVCATMIVLLNILIAMINNRYEKAKRKAENVWRFRTLSTMRALEAMKANVLDLWRHVVRHRKCSGCSSRCCNGDENHKSPGRKSIPFNEHLNRYYLRLLVPVDEKIQKLK